MSRPGSWDGTASPDESGPPLVLVVDAEASVRDAAAEALRRDGDFAVETAADADGALELLAEREADAVVSAYRLGTPDGLDLLSAVREDRRDLPFVLFADGDEAVASEAISAGTSDYVRKGRADQFPVLVDRVREQVVRARSDQRLAETRRRFETLLDNVPGMAYRCRNEQGWPMEFVGAGATNLIGYDPAALVEGEVSYGEDVIHPEDRDHVWETVQDAIDSGESFRVEYRIRTADGEEKWVWEQGRAVLAGGNSRALEGVITDVTERKEREQALRRTNEELELLNRVVRHDIRNEASAVVGWAELAEEHVDATGLEFVRNARASGEQILELTENARDYVAALTADDSLDREPTPLAPTLERELTARRTAYSNADIVLEGSVPDVAVQANELLSSVFRNLINNAVQHNTNETPSIVVDVEDREEEVAVRVADDGPGIPEERRTEVFGRGERGLESEGTGVGLYLVRQLVEGYGGAVSVADNEPRGTVFTVTVPKATTESD
ncbi:MAG: ATP-binding protein [Halobacteriales archaeon]